jgi:hypothetical protein
MSGGLFENDATWQEDRLIFHVYAIDTVDRSTEAINALAATLCATLRDATCAHLWQRDALRLGVDASTQSICGEVRVGDNIDDEWFALRLLLDAVDRLAPRHALAVSDADGEFLLIEAATALPAWLEPATSGNRLFRFGAAWRLLDESRDDSLELQLARARLGGISRGDVKQFAAPTELAAAIDARLQVHPAQGRAHSRHRVRCRVPKDVARVLHAAPQLLAPAVAVFYLREPRDIAAASRMARFGSKDLVDTHVRFSRCLYSQLAQQQFFVPRGTAFVVPPDGDPNQHACQIGMQLACAFEMLVARVAPNGAAADTAFGTALEQVDSAELVVRDPALAMSPWLAAHYDPDDTVTLVRVIDKLCARTDVVVPPCDLSLPDDSAAWMLVSESEVDNLMQSRFDPLNDVDLEVSDDEDDDDDDEEEDDNDNDKKKAKPFDPKKLSGLMASIHEFVERESSILDGIENNPDGPMQFDEHRFMNAFADLFRDKNGERLVVPDDDDDGDGDDDEEEEDEDVAYAKQMEQELSQTTMAQSFERAPSNKPLAEDEIAPVDVNLNLVKNLLTSLAEQRGEPGPSSSLLSQLHRPRHPSKHE